MLKQFNSNLLASSILSFLVAGSLQAQTSAPPAPPDNTQVGQQTPAQNRKAVQLENVTVTAQHREEEVQKIPISINTISGVQLDRLQVRTLEDIKFVVPNITIEPNTGLG